MKKFVIAAAVATLSAVPASAQVAGEQRTLTTQIELTNGAGQVSSGQITISAIIHNYGSGEGRKVMVLPSNNAFVWAGTGPVPRMACSFSTSGNSIAGGGYLAVGTGSRLTCTASSGNGGARREVEVQMR